MSCAYPDCVEREEHRLRQYVPIDEWTAGVVLCRAHLIATVMVSLETRPALALCIEPIEEAGRAR